MRVLQILTMIAVIGCATVFAQNPPPAKVVVAKISQEDIFENQPFIGRFYYEIASQVSSEVAGLVEIVTVREGESVSKGALLLRLNTELLDKEIDARVVRVEQIDLGIKHAEKNYRRLETLYQKEGVSEKVYEDALYSYQNYLKERQIAELELSTLLLKLEKSVIKAPYDGVVMRKNVDSGDWVQQGDNLIQIGSIHDLFVKVPIAETLLRFVVVGGEVVVKIQAFDREITGVIEDVDPIADAKTKNVFIKVRIPAQENVVENMSATVFVPVSENKRLSMIPRDALVKMKGQDFVYTIKDGKAAILPVNIVSFLGDRVGVDNPYFSAGMQVVVEGNERLRPDQQVVVAGEI